MDLQRPLSDHSSQSQSSQPPQGLSCNPLPSFLPASLRGVAPRRPLAASTTSPSAGGVPQVRRFQPYVAASATRSTRAPRFVHAPLPLLRAADHEEQPSNVLATTVRGSTSPSTFMLRSESNGSGLLRAAAHAATPFALQSLNIVRPSSPQSYTGPSSAVVCSCLSPRSQSPLPCPRARSPASSPAAASIGQDVRPQTPDGRPQARTVIPESPSVTESPVASQTAARACSPDPFGQCDSPSGHHGLIGPSNATGPVSPVLGISLTGAGHAAVGHDSGRDAEQDADKSDQDHPIDSSMPPAPNVTPNPKSKKPMAGFVMATTDNLPHVDIWMFVEFFFKVSALCTAFRYFKTQRNSRKDYCDNAVGFVQLQKSANDCWTIFALLTPETSVSKVPYVVSCVIDHDCIRFAKCYGCVSQNGLCKHVVALLSWLHYRSIEPSCTEKKCYWKRSTLSDINLGKPAMLLKRCRPVKPSAYISNGTFLAAVKAELEKNKVSSMLRSQFEDTLHPLDMHRLFFHYAKSPRYQKSYEGMKKYLVEAVEKMDPKVFTGLSTDTVDQSLSPVWRQLRYARITASVLCEASACKAPSAVQRVQAKIFGAATFVSTEAMDRGLELEQSVIDEFSKSSGLKMKKGYFSIAQDLPMFGASPDALGENFVVEVKSPVHNENIKSYIKSDGTPAKKVLCQILIQMKVFNKPKGYLLVADEKFEENKKFTVAEVHLDVTSSDQSIRLASEKNYEFLQAVLENAELFYATQIFPRLITTMKLVRV